MTFFVYIVQCVDGSLYVGMSNDVPSRVRAHNDGTGADWTAARRPVSLVYQEEFPDIERAMKRERQLKKWSHEKKAALVAGDLARLKTLAKRRT